MEDANGTRRTQRMTLALFRPDCQCCPAHKYIITRSSPLVFPHHHPRSVFSSCSSSSNHQSHPVIQGIKARIHNLCTFKQQHKQTMKLLTFAPLLLALVSFTSASPIENPSAELSAPALETRQGQTCVRKLRFRRDQRGTCVDTNVRGTCSGGTIHTGLCPGKANIRCCIY